MCTGRRVARNLIRNESGMGGMVNASDWQGATWVLTSVSLIIRGPNLDPDARPPGRPPRELDGQWRLQCDEHSTRIFSEQLDAVLTAAEPHSRYLNELLGSGLHVALTVRGYVDNDSQISLTSEEMRRVARFGIPLILKPSTSDR
jgi:hypothetical protein